MDVELKTSTMNSNFALLLEQIAKGSENSGERNAAKVALHAYIDAIAADTASAKDSEESRSKVALHGNSNKHAMKSWMYGKVNS